MKQQCNQCSRTFAVSEALQAAADQFEMPVSQLCFECQQIQHMLFRAEWELYERTCDYSGDTIISVFDDGAPFPVYSPKHWNSDVWDPLEYGQDIDFSRPLFDQWQELLYKTPRMALGNINAENSDYCHSSYGNKNCYLIFGGDLNENALYGQLSMRNRDIMDCDYTNDSELCYMSSDLKNCYGCRFAFNSSNCTDSYFINDCSGVNECILSVNLTNVSHYILNEPHTKEEYEKKKAEIFNGNYETLQYYLQEYFRLLDKRVVKYAHNIKTEDCTGDYISSSAHCVNCFDVADSEALENVIFGAKATDCYNSSLLGHGAEHVYNSISPYQSSNVRCSSFIIDSYNIDYSDLIFNSHDVFGCIGLRKKSFCILNKQYSESKYKELRDKLIDHMKSTKEWGNFFPKELGIFPYNTSTAQSYFPTTQKAAKQAGYHWKEENTDKTVAKSAPDDTGSTSLACQDCTKPFRIVPVELAMLKKMNMPLPRRCPRCRFHWRSSLRNPRNLWGRQCMCTQPQHSHQGRCTTEFETTYSPDRKELVYCEDCYQQEIT